MYKKILEDIMMLKFGIKGSVSECWECNGSKNRTILFKFVSNGSVDFFAARKYSAILVNEEYESLLLQIAIKTVCNNNGLLTDIPLSTKTGSSFFEYKTKEKEIWSISKGIQGDCLDWSEWEHFQYKDGVAEEFGHLQAKWDNCFYKYSFDEIVNFITENDMDVIKSFLQIELDRSFVIERIKNKYFLQNEFINLYNLCNAEKNLEYFQLVSNQIKSYNTKYPKLVHTYSIWEKRIEEFLIEIISEQKKFFNKNLILQYSDMSPNNSFFKPNKFNLEKIDGYIDFELSRWSSIRFDLGVAASMRFGDELNSISKENIINGISPKTKINLSTNYKKFILSYLKDIDRKYLPNCAEFQSFFVALKINIMGLIFWIPKIAESDIYDDKELQEYLCKQINRLVARFNVGKNYYKNFVNTEIYTNIKLGEFV